MNPYTDLSNALVTELTTELTALSYAPLDVRKGIWKPRALAPFDRYLVFIAPPLSDPWREIRDEGPKLVTFVLRAEIFLLVKNYNEDQSVYGDTAPDLGVFQLMGDVKTILRNTDLGGLVLRSYRETEGGSSFETGATGGFDTGEHGWVHRSKLVYTARTYPFCHPA
jgi:hypothetical protein